MIKEKEKLIVETQLTSLPLGFKGKVRDVYDLKDKLLIVATDRVSAFDYVLPTPIPTKGKILTQMSVFWFNYLKDIVPNHLITSKVEEYPDFLLKDASVLRGRSMLVKKAFRINIECVVRGYLAGSAWTEYKERQEACGIKLPIGLKESSFLPEPIFTPAIKSESGTHDINITAREFIDNVGEEKAFYLREKSIALYKKASEYAKTKGIIIADTKFEFGEYNGDIILIDEILTPDSSRFWDKDLYKEGEHQVSHDKQFVRDYLENTNWDKKSDPPFLPNDVVEKTQKVYQNIFERLTGKSFQS